MTAPPTTGPTVCIRQGGKMMHILGILGDKKEALSRIGIDKLKQPTTLTEEDMQWYDRLSNIDIKRYIGLFDLWAKMGKQVDNAMDSANDNVVIDFNQLVESANEDNNMNLTSEQKYNWSTILVEYFTSYQNVMRNNPNIKITLTGGRRSRGAGFGKTLLLRASGVAMLPISLSVAVVGIASGIVCASASDGGRDTLGKAGQALMVTLPTRLYEIQQTLLQGSNPFETPETSQSSGGAQRKPLDKCTVVELKQKARDIIAKHKAKGKKCTYLSGYSSMSKPELIAALRRK